MPLTMHELTLRVTRPRTTVPVEGTWTIRLHNVGGIAINPDNESAIAGMDEHRTVSGQASFFLPASAELDPPTTRYVATFKSHDVDGKGRPKVKITTPPFLLDGSKELEDLLVPTDLPVTPSDVELARQYAEIAQAAAASGVQLRGRKANFAALPASGNTNGDAWFLDDTGHVWSWKADTTAWVDLGKWRGADGPQGDPGDQGIQGVKGDKGDTGAAGPGVPTGGTTGQVLVKTSGTNYATGWANAPTGTGDASTKLDKSPESEDGLVRNAGTTEVILEVLDKFAISGADGRPSINGVNVDYELAWRPGNPDPTAGGTKTLPTWVHVTAYLGIGDIVPGWVLAHPNADVVQEVEEDDDGGTTTPPPTVALVAKWNGVGLADELAVAADVAGTGDTAIGGIFTGGSGPVTPRVEQTGVPVWYPAGARMVRFAPSGGGSAFYFGVAAGTTRRARFHLRTPATFPGAFPVLAFRSGASTDCARLIIGGAGQLRISNSDNVHVVSTGTSVFTPGTDYFVEFALTQNADADEGTVQCWVYDVDGAELYNTNAQKDETASPVGFGTTHDRVYFGNLGAITTTYYEGRFAVSNDPATRIGISA